MGRSRRRPRSCPTRNSRWLSALKHRPLTRCSCHFRTRQPSGQLGLHSAKVAEPKFFIKCLHFHDWISNQIFIAEHGSWNRSKKIGYRVTLVRVENNRAVDYEPFATGWLQGETAWGRPADVLVMPDGSLLVSDDLAGAIYRISYTGKGS